MGIFEKFKIGLNKSASSFSDGIKNLVIKKKIDEETLNKIEEFLIMSDVGVDVAGEIRKIISEKKILPNQDSIMQVNQILLNYLAILYCSNYSLMEKIRRIIRHDVILIYC